MDKESRFRTISRQLAINLVNRRYRRGLTQAQLAKNLDIHRSVVTSIESGHGNPTLALMISVADFFEIKLAELFAYSRTMIERMSDNDFGEYNFLKNGLNISRRTLKLCETWNYEIKPGRQVFIKANGGYAKITADYLRASDIVNDTEFYRVVGGGVIEIKGVDDEAASELFVIETALQEGR
jgi:putative transcriptional regulator